MKIRAGFVSNSSSSSFVFIGREISRIEVERGETIHPIFADGDACLNEGADFFEVTEDIREWIKDHPEWRCPFMMYEVHACMEDNALVLDRDTIMRIPEKVEIQGFHIDYNTTETLDEFLERYT